MTLAPQSLTLYEYYTGGGIVTGLSDSQSYFTLNNRNITLYSGSMHYFRVPKQYWRDRLRKLRAAGLNTVETYVPWNLHESEPNFFDFGQNGSDMEQFLDLSLFLKTAQEEDLLAIVRPGPFICSEWEFGGLPSWLLRDKEIKIRTSQPNFMRHVTRYFNVLLPILAALQFTLGGPIISLQVENEYGSTEQKGKFVPDRVYLEQLVNLYRKNGIIELLFTSDSPTAHGSIGTLPGVLLQTANFAGSPEKEFDRLRQLQNNKPSMATEFWIGWFDHWSEHHHLRSTADFSSVLEKILQYPASVNMYMFHGGTSWGFMNGANINDDETSNRGFQPDTTSYDYDAALTEAGDYTDKYTVVKKLLKRYTDVVLRTPPTPAITPKTVYPSVKITLKLNLDEIIRQIPEKVETVKPIPMELLPINNGTGQSYGYIIYKKIGVDIPKNSVLKIQGHVCDTVMVLVNGVLMSKPLTDKTDLDRFGYWRINNGSLNLNEKVNNATLELVVENLGRNNFGYLNQFNQYKGIWQGGVFLNDEELLNWQNIPLQYKTNWINGLSGWHVPATGFSRGPSLLKGLFEVEKPKDTFINMQTWNRGIVIINGFVLGRYASKLGPQQTLYLPAPLLNSGTNEIVVFEHFNPKDDITFSSKPIYYTSGIASNFGAPVIFVNIYCVIQICINF